MKKFFFVFVLCLIFITISFQVASFMKLYNLKNTVLSSRATDQANIALTVESPPGEEEEAPSAPSGAAAGGGARATRAITLEDFTVFPAELNIIMESGEVESKGIKVKNTGRSSRDIIILVTGIGEIVAADTNEISLAAGEEKTVNLLISAPESGVHAGRIIFSSDGLQREVFVLINVKKGVPLFDVSLIIPAEYRIVEIGKIVRAFISLVQIGEQKETDVAVTYFVKDFNGNTLFTESETILIERSKSFAKEVDTSNLAADDYVYAMEVVYEGGFASSSAHFKVKERETYLKLLILLALFILALIVIIYSILKYKKSKKYFKIRNKRARR